MQDPLAFILAFAHIGAAMALCNGIIVALGQGNIVSKAIESMARQPEASGSIRSTMILGLAMSETTGIYGLLIAIIMLFANPLIPIYLQSIGQ